MKILYLVNAPRISLGIDEEDIKTNISWVDSILENLVKEPSLIIGMAVPVTNKVLQKKQMNCMTIYGLPNPGPRFFITRLFRRIKMSDDYRKIRLNIFQVISDFNPDLIQIFGTENSFGSLINDTNKPVLIHFQGSLQVVSIKWFTGISRWDQFRYATLKDLLLFRGNYHEYNMFNRRAKREEVILRNCRYFIGRTTFDKRLISLLSPHAKYFSCDEFIRKNFLIEQWDMPQTDPITCISILKGVTYKGIDLILRTMHLLVKYSSIPVRFKICGVEENEEVVSILRKKYSKSDCFSRIDFLGKLSTDFLISALRSSNFFIHPSYIENSSNSICEAMALGMPVICTNVGGTNSLIKDGEDGILVQEGEPYSLAAAINELINNYDYARLLGRHAREKSQIRHNPDAIKTKMMNIYNTIISDDKI